MDDLIFSHVVEVYEESRQVTIYRMFSNGRKQMYTKIALPSKTFDQDKPGFAKFTQALGENLLFDSPTARKILGI